MCLWASAAMGASTKSAHLSMDGLFLEHADNLMPNLLGEIQPVHGPVGGDRIAYAHGDFAAANVAGAERQYLARSFEPDRYHRDSRAYGDERRAFFERTQFSIARSAALGKDEQRDA